MNMIKQYSNPQSIITRVIDVFTITLTALPFIVFGYYVLKFSVNIPMHDDYNRILGFINSFITSEGWKEKARLLLLQQQGENRSVFLKAQFLVQYWLFGEVNFQVLLFLGNFAYLSVVAILIYQCHKMGFSKSQLLPIPYLMLGLVSSDNITFVSGQVYIWGLLFSLLFFITLTSRRVLWSNALYTISIYTMAGGLILYPLGIMFLLMKKWWRDLKWFLVLSTPFTLLYFYKYERPGHIPRMEDAFIHFHQTIQAFFAFIGNAMFSYDVALITGIIAVLTLITIVTVTFDNADFLFLSSVWILIMSILVALGRSSIELGIGQLPPRYAIYSLFAFSLIFIWITNQARLAGEHVKKVSLILSIIAVSYFSTTILIDWETQTFARVRDYKITGLALFALKNRPDLLVYPKPNQVKNVLIEARDLGVFDYREVGLKVKQPIHPSTQAPISNTNQFSGQIEEKFDYLIRGWALIPNLPSADSKIYILLKNGNEYIKLETIRSLRPDVATSLGKPVYYQYSGYEMFLGAYAIPQGSYTLGILVINGNKSAIKWETEEIDLP